MSKPARVASFLSVLLLTSPTAGALEPQAPAHAGVRPSWAGVVVALRGAATATPAGGVPTALTGIDWIADGAVLATRDGAELTIALRDGSRYRLGALARAKVSVRALSETSGPVETLGAISPIPDVAPLSRPVQGQLGAVRIRSAVLRGLYPATPYTSLADATTLSFEAPPEGAEARVEIEDETGETLFETRTKAGSLRLPAGILRPGARYFWRVRTIGRSGPAAHGTAEFETLPYEVALSRDRLAGTVSPLDAGAITLAAEVDRQLGLLREAREGFAKVLALEPGNERVSRAAAELAAEEKALAARE